MAAPSFGNRRGGGRDIGNLHALESSISTLHKTTPEDDICFDCGLRETNWMSVTNGVFLCVSCAGMHRGFGVDISSIRSLALDELDEVETAAMSLAGNTPVRTVMGLPPLGEISRRYPTAAQLLEKYSSVLFEQWRRALRIDAVAKLGAAREEEERQAEQRRRWAKEKEDKENERKEMMQSEISDCLPQHSTVVFHEPVSDSWKVQPPTPRRRRSSLVSFLFYKRNKDAIRLACGEQKESVVPRLAQDGVVAFSTYNDTFGAAVDKFGRILTAGIAEYRNGLNITPNDHGQLGIGLDGGANLSPDADGRIGHASCHQGYLAIPNVSDHNLAKPIIDENDPHSPPFYMHYAREEGIFVISSPVRFKTVACGQQFSVAVSENGALYSWGNHDEGRLGLGSEQTTDVTFPKRLTARTILGHYFSKVACGFAHVVAITVDGEAFAWGRSYCGGTGLEKRKCITEPMRIMSLSGLMITGVACGMSHTVVLTADGVPYAFGDNSYEETTGISTGNLNNRCILHPTKIGYCSRDLKYTQVSCGRLHTVLLDSEGGVHGQGHNAHGQLGKEKARSIHQIPTHKNMRALSIHAFDFRTSILLEDNNVYVLGDHPAAETSAPVLSLQRCRSSPAPYIFSGVMSTMAVQVHMEPLVETDAHTAMNNVQWPDIIIRFPDGGKIKCHRYLLHCASKPFLDDINHAIAKAARQMDGVETEHATSSLGEELSSAVQPVVVDSTDLFEERGAPAVTAECLRLFLAAPCAGISHPAKRDVAASPGVAWLRSKYYQGREVTWKDWAVSRWSKLRDKKKNVAPFENKYSDVVVVSRPGEEGEPPVMIPSCLDFLRVRCPILITNARFTGACQSMRGRSANEQVALEPADDDDDGGTTPYGTPRSGSESGSSVGDSSDGPCTAKDAYPPPGQRIIVDLSPIAAHMLMQYLHNGSCMGTSSSTPPVETTTGGPPMTDIAPYKIDALFELCAYAHRVHQVPLVRHCEDNLCRIAPLVVGDADVADILEFAGTLKLPRLHATYQHYAGGHLAAGGAAPAFEENISSSAGYPVSRSTLNPLSWLDIFLGRLRQ